MLISTAARLLLLGMTAAFFDPRASALAGASDWPPADPGEEQASVAFTAEWASAQRTDRRFVDLQTAAGARGHIISFDLNSATPRVVYSWIGTSMAGRLRAIVYPDGAFSAVVSPASGEADITLNGFGAFVCPSCRPPVNACGGRPSWIPRDVHWDVFDCPLTVTGPQAMMSSAASPLVGERHLTAAEPSAALRSLDHRTSLRITVWYPATVDAVEASLDIGPPGKPLFRSGSAALDAAFADGKPRPVILLSHGFGGTARMMAWFGTALAREGYVVVAVEHPGSNGADPMTVPGAVLFWERSGDLAAALDRVEADEILAPHLDRTRLGVAGFSAGGFAALAAAGGRVDLQRFRAFCESNPDDGVCKPQQEFAVTMQQVETLLDQPEMAAEVERSKADLSVPGAKAVFVMAPAIVQAFDPASLHHVQLPVSILLGDADTVAPPATNGEFAARLIPGAQIKVLPGVDHYDFLADCTPAGVATVPVCSTNEPRDATHRTAIEDATSFFGRDLR